MPWFMKVVILSNQQSPAGVVMRPSSPENLFPARSTAISARASIDEPENRH